MLISILDKINSFNEFIFTPIDSLVEKLPLAPWAIDAVCDSIHLLPFLFFVFILIEFLEFYYADKINSSLRKTGDYGVIIGSLAAIFPQCGFSVMASSLYSRRIITRGTLIAVYLATSDETIPVLLAIPQKAYLIIPIVGIKLFIAILMGYFIDLVLHQKKSEVPGVYETEEKIEEGCCKHDIEHGSKRELIIHPIMHTINIFVFILSITLVLNFCMEHFSMTSLSGGKYTKILLASLVGLIPNCAVSIGLTMMLVKGSITFAACMAGLLSNSGLGLLVLLKNNEFKDTMLIIFIILAISIVSGAAIEFLT